MPTPKSPYRSEIDALRERKETLEQELARLREQTTELEGLRARQARLASELAAVESRIGYGHKRALPLLERVQVASPCHEDWGSMVGDDRVRFCLKCEKNVYNLSSMTREAAEALLAERIGDELCVRFYQRADGTVMTEDCPVGVTKKRRKRAALAIAGAGAMAFAAAAALGESASRCGTRRMGAVAVGTFPGEPALGEAKMGDVAYEPPVTGSAAPTPPAAPTSATPHVPQIMGRMAPATKMGKPAPR